MGRFAALARLDAHALAAKMRELGAAPQPDAAALAGERGWLWHGLGLAMPGPLFGLFGKFGKTFVVDPASGAVRGWNVRMKQSHDARWAPRTVAGRELIYGRYEVTAAPADAPYPGALLIDYGLGANRAWDPLRTVRDFVVAVTDDLLLGHMWLKLGPRLVRTPSWFALARGEPLT